VAGCCERGIEPPGSVNFEEFLDWLSTFYFVKKDSASCSYLVRYLYTCVMNVEMNFFGIFSM
jgi:hypothetical protein